MGLWTQARGAEYTQAVWDALLVQRERVPKSYDPAMVTDLPEIGQRYFASAIAPGTSRRAHRCTGWLCWRWKAR